MSSTSSNDAKLLEALTTVKGIGRWTAQMFMLFRLGRPNILPDLDLGVQKGIQRVYGLRRLPKPVDVLKRGAIWSPFSSVAAWYLWRSLELADETGAVAARCRTVPAARKKRRGTKAAAGTSAARAAKSARTKRAPTGRRRAKPVARAAAKHGAARKPTRPEVAASGRAPKATRGRSPRRPRRP